MNLFEHESTDTTLTLAWEKVTNSLAYEIQWCQNGKSDEGDWKTLSDKLQGNIMLKKNLQPETTFQFRGRFKETVGWSTFGPVLQCVTLSPSAASARIAAPTPAGVSADSITVAWKECAQAVRYEVQIKQEGAGEWTTVSDKLSGTAVRKKNLTSNTTYMWRVRPGEHKEEERWGCFSLASPPIKTTAPSPHLDAMFGPCLLTQKNEKVPAQSLAGKVIAVYCSAAWCGPCKQFSPVLGSFYSQVKQAGGNLEIVFVSLDRDAGSCNSYFSTMAPWLMVPYDHDRREGIISDFRIQSVPTLLVFSASGKLLRQNAVQEQPLTLQTFKAWAMESNTK